MTDPIRTPLFHSRYELRAARDALRAGAPAPHDFEGQGISALGSMHLLNIGPATKDAARNFLAKSKNHGWGVAELDAVITILDAAILATGGDPDLVT
jgi:hypothetical protein